MMVAIWQDINLKYPDSEYFFSPSEAFPEYKLGHIAAKPNGVYTAVRQCFITAGLDKSNLGKSTWNPLSHFIS
ncbi:MAG: hypothetical protein L7F78_22655, partial [Syntrophales bacterium LBB04]|nr:hypothetical protein [Syntrophales bacterium LBB04]